MRFVLLLVMLTYPILAHHSHGNYVMTEYTQMKGTIKNIQWLNPHTWVYLEVMGDDGKPAVWALEGASVIELQRRGWTRENIKAGDKISVRCHRLRDGSKGCLLGYVTGADGVEKLFD